MVNRKTCTQTCAFQKNQTDLIQQSLIGFYQKHSQMSNTVACTYVYFINDL